MPDLISHVHFLNLKTAAFNIVCRQPDGIRQSEVAKELGIPSKFDHNWITKSLLDGMVEENLIKKSESKLFTAV